MASIYVNPVYISNIIESLLKIQLDFQQEYTVVCSLKKIKKPFQNLKLLLIAAKTKQQVLHITPNIKYKTVLNIEYQWVIKSCC